MTQVIRQVLAVCLMLAASAAQALQPQTAEQAPAEEAEAAPAPAAQERRDKPAAPATRFTPSEKIGADSAVSFPVDI